MRFEAATIRGLTVSCAPDKGWRLALEIGTRRLQFDHRLQIDLDQNMRAIPPLVTFEQSRSRGWTLSASPASPVAISSAVASATPSYRVSETQARVLLTISRTWRSTLIRLEVPFRFVGQVIPERICIVTRMRRLGLSTSERRFEGLYLGSPRSTRANLVDFLTQPDQRFLFTKEGPDLLLPYDALSPMLPRVQWLPDTTVWGTTWPNEVAFWNSKPGLEFLAQQIRSHGEAASIPRRIAIAPGGLGLPQVVADRFLAELDVQAALGVDVRVVEPENVATELSGNADALLCMGSDLAVLYSNIWTDGTRARLALGDDVQSLLGVYDTVQNQGIPLTVYRRTHPLPARLYGYVGYRLGGVRACARALAANNGRYRHGLISAAAKDDAEVGA